MTILNSRRRSIVFNRVLVEFLLLNLSLLVVVIISSLDADEVRSRGLLLGGHFPFFLLFNLGWLLTIVLNGDPGSYLSKNLRRRLKYLLFNSLLLTGIIAIAGNFLGIDFSQTSFLAFPIIIFFLLDLLLFRWGIRNHEGRQANTANSRILILGGREKQEGLQGLSRLVQDNRYEVVGWIDKERSLQNGTSLPVVGHLEDLSSVLPEHFIDEIFIDLSSLPEEDVKRAVNTADYHGVRVNLIMDTPNFHYSTYTPSTEHHLPVYQLRESPLDRFDNYICKKLFDLVFASLVLLLLSPVFLILGLLIFIEGKGKASILYTPIRKGERGGVFKCYKFRTMSVSDDPVNGTRSTEPNDQRITLVGKYLRKYDLDELPQFWNVLKGDMSVVGPRPHRIHLQRDFRKIVNEYMVRHYVKPGITGWAQVNGWRGPTVTEDQKRERVRHDLWYIEHWSFWMDLKIVWLTVFGRKTRKNAF